MAYNSLVAHASQTHQIALGVYRATHTQNNGSDRRRDEEGKQRGQTTSTQSNMTSCMEWTLKLSLELGLGLVLKLGLGLLLGLGHCLPAALTDCLTGTDVDEYQVNPFVTSKKASR